MTFTLLDSIRQLRDTRQTSANNEVDNAKNFDD